MIVYSQTTSVQGLKTETKKEIVFVLQDYEAVLRELAITQELLALSNLKKQEYSALTFQLEKANRTLELKNEYSENQIEILKTRLENKSISFLDKVTYIGVGTGIGVVLVFLLKLLTI